MSIAGFLLFVGACGEATVEGEVFVVTQSGDGKPAAGGTVYLLDIPERAIVDAWNICTRATDSMKSIAGQYSDLSGRGLHDSASVVIRRLTPVVGGILDTARRVYRQHAIDSASTGLAARFALNDVARGRYVLYAEWRADSTEYMWWAPIEVAGRSTVRRNLANADRMTGCARPQ